ncbi:hypothetical protein WJT86_07640 [Microvirga sp. W0021]|uniref:Chromosomal replication initiator protein DnaA domain-containing protein n=1 Tax=Hohaiivirga grylli TaxID=3133970 RepID=A0ABV0BJ47_9HYPH
MTDNPKQLTFDLGMEPRFGREDFLVSPSNELAYNLLEAWPEWPDNVLLLFGPEGSGKSHLAAIWAEQAHAWTIDAFALTKDRVPHLASNGALLIEDADQALIDEAAFFHLLNLTREKGSYVVITAAKPLGEWGLNTPDLVSRLRLAPSVSMEAADNALLGAVLVKLFMDRQLIVDTSIIEYIVVRLARSLSRAEKLVSLLDKEALSRRRRITKTMVSDILGREENDV